MAQFLDPRPIRCSAKTNRRITKAARRTGLSESDTIRLAIDTGLEIIERLPDYLGSAARDVATPVLERIPAIVGEELAKKEAAP